MASSTTAEGWSVNYIGEAAFDIAWVCLHYAPLPPIIVFLAGLNISTVGTTRQRQSSLVRLLVLRTTPIASIPTMLNAAKVGARWTCPRGRPGKPSPGATWGSSPQPANFVIWGQGANNMSLTQGERHDADSIRFD